ncbi:eukaryotic translation initiation factor 2-alpha kinase-like isoform X3 [Pararge aegeria]|uniref:eukaryotic translation initiation factor 2-alpha kinase-like isoform X3 n=1 Tax=Pararge aegeria TaxID=116150 RepID=UPI0019D08C12|nr:eukaryotic translation initiation factor 2-alpha kinase-like isoform X3 [Pararge aegeria]
MSAWYWRMIALKAAFVLTCFVSYIRTDTIQKLPFCNPHAAKDAPIYNDLVIVSSLDGRVTAFSTEDGIKVWALETQPLLSSNLHHVELTSSGKWVRLVPSLRGSLYSLSGDSIEPLPFDAEQLLSASFKYSEDLVIAGARETLWVGVDAHNGKVVYECSSSGCNSEQQTARAGRDVLVLRRHSNTVRALDPRSGTEKWNFSVAEHQMALSRRECAGTAGPPSPVAIAVALPEGVVVVRRSDSSLPLWQHKLDAPVSNMWRLQGGLLEHMDVLWEAAQAIAELNPPVPSLYLGVHNTQLYIQESVLYAQKMKTALSPKPMPWKLKQSTPLLADSDTALLPPHDVESNDLSAVALHGNFGKKDNTGFFLYLQQTCDQSVQVDGDLFDDPDVVPPNSSDDQPDDHHHVHVHVYSLWFWWKEVLLIAVSSALLMNLMIWPRFFAPKLRPTTPLPLNQEYIVVERHYERPPSNNGTEYSGRYENDFTPLRCLGKGGFGVVFEARNNIDHCSYAVKRITLPKRESKRERVLREVRALAKLEHEHIVRYFNAWLEEPPPNWQEQRDSYWMSQLGGVSVVMSEDYTSPASPAEKSPAKGGSVTLNLPKSVDDCIDALDYEKKLSEPRRHRCNDSFSIIFSENASKDAHLTTATPTKRFCGDVTSPNMLSKNVRSGDNDDSFIVFANSQNPSEHSSGFSEARKDVSNKILEKVKESDSFGKDGSKKKKKGHTRHWSLDMCVRAPQEAGVVGGSKMYLYIQMQLCRRESLHDWLRSNRTWEVRRDQIKTLFSQIVSAVEYVHLAGLIHRDLKPSNIFFAPDGKVKVGDFGLVTTMTENSQDGESPQEINAHASHTHRVGTHLYMSPEQLLGRPYSYKVDIYSLGLVLFELLHPFGTEAERVSCLMRLKNGNYPEPFQQSYPNETEVLKLMLSDDPTQRPTASGVKARAPLYQCTDEQFHFTLPTFVTC